MPETLDALEEKLRALDQRGEETTEKVDLLIAFLMALGSHDPQRTMAVSREICALADRLSYTRGKAYGLGYMGFVHHLLSEHETAYAKLQQALSLVETTDDVDGHAMVLGQLAGVQLSMGAYDQALATGMKALKLFQQTGNRLQEAWLLEGLGTGHTNFGNYDRAFQFYQEALAVFEDAGERIGEARALTGLGTVYHRQGAYDQALPYHVTSLKIFQEEDNRIGEARALNDLGVIYYHLGDGAAALDYLHQSLALREALGTRQAQSTSLIHLGDVHLQHDEVEKALDVLHRALAIAEDIKARPRIYQAHQGLAEAYERRGDFARALAHHKAFQRVREAVQGEKVQSEINLLHTRFEVEKAEQEAEIERLRNVELKEKNEELARLLDELKATQAQLIQAEKMASLGQLTAGIAHEIQNPLNFVNNFSQISVELAKELAEELAAHREQPVADVLDEVQDLLDDLTFNAEKIREHGQRAEGIVKGMMLHARGKPGERRPTDLNALVEEYVNLAYHGMRARHTDFNVTIERAYDEAVGKMDLVPQEMGRVLLNLLNNAFHAVYEKAQNDDAYTPTVTVATQRGAHAVEIEVQDTGGGIPEAVREKIFEPFFTTKPTGQGTGLGLSISYDIVTQGHGGTLAVESTEGEGAAFIVTLPTKKP